MNGSEIHWLEDALIVVGCLIAFVVLFVGYGLCAISGHESRIEEARELRDALSNLDRAA